VKGIGGCLCKNLHFLLDEPPKQTANELNKHLDGILQTFPPLSENYLIPETPKDKIPEISAKQIIENIHKLLKILVIQDVTRRAGSWVILLQSKRKDT
jgi:hypothetical protein